MQRLLYHGGCDPANGPAPKLKIRPATFATTTEAWNYFVRHPEDFQLIDEEDEENNLRLDFDSQTLDTFDYLDAYMHQDGSAVADPDLTGGGRSKLVSANDDDGTTTTQEKESGGGNESEERPPADHATRN